MPARYAQGTSKGHLWASRPETAGRERWIRYAHASAPWSPVCPSTPMPENHLPEVRRQSEALPYPSRNPEDERKRLISTWLEDLPLINHYCFGGLQSFGRR